MSARRTVATGVTIVSLLAAPTVAMAVTRDATMMNPSLSQALEMAAARKSTHIRFLSFDHNLPHLKRANIRGQVTATVGGRRGAVKGVHVKLYRKVNGTSGWKHIAGQRVGRGSHPKFVFHPLVVANAQYRVRFGGNQALEPSRSATSIQAYRTFSPTMTDRTGRFHGQMSPRYRHRVVILQKRSCAQCGWSTVRSNRTGDRSTWSFKVRAPQSGRWWWRVTTPPSTRFIRSSSGVYTTELG